MLLSCRRRALFLRKRCSRAGGSPIGILLGQVRPNQPEAQGSLIAFLFNIFAFSWLLSFSMDDGLCAHNVPLPLFLFFPFPEFTCLNVSLVLA